MTRNRHRALWTLVAALVGGGLHPSTEARGDLSRVEGQPAAQAAGQTLDETLAPGANYNKADFRFWYAGDAARLSAVLVLVPGSNGDGRSQVDDPVWRAFAVKHHLGLVGVRLTDKPHDQSFIEHYVDVRQGSGQALLDALGAFASRSGHPEVATAPLLLWGMSAGGEFNYEFVAWKPERVAAFVVNKGGIYYTALAPRAARDVPGMLFVGGKDLEFRTSTITGLFAVNRRAGALWALAEEPGAAHIVGKSRDVAVVFFEDMLALRLAAGPMAPMTPLSEKSGFLGDFKTRSFEPVGASTPAVPTAWLPTERVARAWRAMVTEMPIGGSTDVNPASGGPMVPDGPSEQPAGPATYGYHVVRSFPHDAGAFTQGLVYRDGFLFESTGLNGRSSLRKVKLETGEVVQQQTVDSKYFAEGLADWHDRLIQLTWRSQIGFVYDLASFRMLRSFAYPGEGWGLTHDGARLILSDGSPTLRFLNPETLTESGRVTVTDRGRPIDNLNELEFVKGEVFANVWQTDRIARVSPSSGQVTGWIDLRGLLPSTYRLDAGAVLNGIAYDAAADRLFVTGKLWPKVFEITLERRP